MKILGREQRGYTPERKGGEKGMPTNGSITKTVRITEEDVVTIEGIMRKKGFSWSGAVKYLVELHRGTPQKSGVSQTGTPLKGTTHGNLAGYTPNKLLGVATDLNMEYEKFANEISRLINDGCIMKEGNRLVAHENGVDLGELFDLCHETGAEPQKVVDAMARGLRRGK